MSTEDSASIRSGLSTTDSIALSEIDRNDASAIMKSDSGGGERADIHAMIELDDDVPDSLLREVFYELVKCFSTHQLKSTDSNESTKSTAISAILQSINFHFIKKYHLSKHSQLEIAKEQEFRHCFRNILMKDRITGEPKFRDPLVKGKPDYEIIRARHQTDQCGQETVQFVQGTEPIAILTVEAKKELPIYGLSQCGVAMKRKEHFQGSQKVSSSPLTSTIYGSNDFPPSSNFSASSWPPIKRHQLDLCKATERGLPSFKRPNCRRFFSNSGAHQRGRAGRQGQRLDQKRTVIATSSTAVYDNPKGPLTDLQA